MVLTVYLQGRKSEDQIMSKCVLLIQMTFEVFTYKLCFWKILSSHFYSFDKGASKSLRASEQLV